MTPSWGWRLSTCDGPMYGITGNNSEKKVAKNILRGGPGSRPIVFSLDSTTIMSESIQYTVQCKTKSNPQNIFHE